LQLWNPTATTSSDRTAIRTLSGRPVMTKLFISHSSQDDTFVRDLRTALADHGQAGWIDSRELRGGAPLWPAIQEAIEGAAGFAVVISPDALQSDWVSDELEHALKVQKERGKDKFPVIPLLLNGTKLGAFKKHFGEEPVCLSVSSAAGGIEAAMNALLAACGKKLPADVPPTPQPQAEPLEELVLELTNLKFHEEAGVRRASAHAQLVYEPATPGQPQVHTAQKWTFVAPLGPIEVEELRWYLEKYAIWPSGVPVIQERARKVEENLVKWGRDLHSAALPTALTVEVMNAWATASDRAGRRFSVYVDTALVVGAPDAEVQAVKEVATLLLGLPWELLHDGTKYLFQGAKPARVRRRLPHTKGFGVPIVATPIRILLVTARPEDDSCGYIDHRASALPLVEAMEALPGLVEITVLNPPTLPALRAELDRAREQKKPYHVVHFDGHGIYNRTVGLGGLCFELPEDVGKLEERRHVTVFTSELGPVLHEHRVPLVFLEACQSAQAEKASESVASELLKVGVASVVAMSHSVLVETARRFVEAFYRALAGGKRVGDAMLAGQRQLKDDTFRGRVFGAGELRLEDWFVPVLFQEKDDPQLFKTTPARQTRDDFQKALKSRLGAVPEASKTGFIGRSRELLGLERLLRQERYAVLRGQGGEGKTTLAAEFARWLIRSHQMRRAVFVSVETHSTRSAVLDALGRQLVGPKYSVAEFEGLEQAVQPLERELAERATLVVMDNMESILQPPGLESPAALSEETRRELDAILALCARLNAQGDTRFVFTSREALPEPFDGARNRRELFRLGREDAVKLVERVLNDAGGAGASGDAAREPIEQLVDAVHCHARTLALLAPALRSRGVEATRTSLVELMGEMEAKFPGSREKSVYASVELSLRRMSEANRQRARVLGVFHGGVQLGMLEVMMQWDEKDVGALGDELVETGLATKNPYNHLALNPALCPYLRGQMEKPEREALAARWIKAMVAYAKFLEREHSENTEVAATLTVLELPNLFALLELVQRAGDAEATIDLATSLFTLLQFAGKPRLLERVGQVRDAAATALGDDWNHAQFQAARTRIEQQLASAHLREALTGAQELLQSARAAGEQAYPNADYDLALACFLLARVLQTAGGSEQALPLLDEARQRFEAIETREPGCGAARMAAVCFAEQGDCLLFLGRLNEAAAAYEERIRGAEHLGDRRGVAVSKGQLGTVRMFQGRHQEALKAYAEAREQFTQLNEPGSVAVSWHQTGMVYQEAGQPEAAEDAYRKSLSIEVQLGNVAGQAGTLVQLGNLYKTVLGRTEESIPFYRQAADSYSDIREVANEGKARSGLAIALRILRRLDEARQEIKRSIECAESFGHTTQPWKFWSILADIETDAGDSVASAEANGRAVASFLAYRRDGGENHDASGRISLAVTQSLLTGDPATAVSLLQQLAAHPDAGSSFRAYLQALQAIVAGSRDRTLADSPELAFDMAAEIILLIETLEQGVPG
jgi:tetratricopeptide (TPR) repeat protein